MRDAETILGIIRERGRRGLPLLDVYRQLFQPSLYLRAYGRISRNKGAMTTGTTPETVDGMSLANIEKLIDAVRFALQSAGPLILAPLCPLIGLAFCSATGAAFGGVQRKE